MPGIEGQTGRGNGAPPVPAPASIVVDRLSDLAALELVEDASLATLLGRIVDVSARLLSATGASVVLWDAALNDFTVGASNVPGQDDDLPTSRVRREGGATRWIVDNQEPIFVADIAADPFRGNSLPAEFGIQSWAGIPIVADGSSLGVLYVLDRAARRYAEDDIAFLSLVARRAANAIVNARIIGESRAARERSEALAWVANALIAADGLDEVLQAVVEGAAAALEAERVTLVTIDALHREVLDHVAGGWGTTPAAAPSFADFSEGLSGWVLRKDRVAVSVDATVDQRVAPAQQERHRTAGLGPATAVALRFGDSILGTLTVARRADEPPFGDAEVDLVIAMANQAAVAIENVRLIEATRSSLRETAALFSVSQELAAAGDMEELLAAVGAGASELLPADVVEVRVHRDEPGDHSTVLAGPGAGHHDPDTPFIGEDSPAHDHLAAGRAVTAVGGDPRAVVAPLRVHERVMGYIAARNRPDQPAFEPRQVDLLMTLAAHAASAVEAVGLFVRVQLLAVTDELTGAYNRRHLFELAEFEFAQARRYMRPLSAIMFDLDRFKDINDTYGHAIGDQVLRWVAGHCRGVVRDVDVWGRYGGEEFAVVLPETELKGAVQVAERLRREVADLPIETARGPIHVTVSLGVAELGDEMSDVHALIDRADAAMYFAKRTGRNRVESA